MAVRRTFLPAFLTTILPVVLAGCGIGQPCGGSGGTVCEPDLFCWFDNGACGDDGVPGVCLPRPDACVLIYAPVCGCDGETYGNDCQAYVAGVSVRSTGACDDGSSGEICGGIAGLPCDEGEFCNLPIGQCCCDFQGVCTAVPQVCPELFAPVCGCDDRTYGNACEAAAAGVSVQSQGECPGDGGPG